MTDSSAARSEDQQVFESLKQEIVQSHIEMLRVLYRPEQSIAARVRFQGGSGQLQVTVRGILHKVFANAQEGQVDALWTHLAARGLVNDEIYHLKYKLIQPCLSGRAVDYSDMVLARLSSARTPFGRRFSQFIIESVETTDDVIDAEETTGRDDKPDASVYVPLGGFLNRRRRYKKYRSLGTLLSHSLSRCIIYGYTLYHFTTLARGDSGNKVSPVFQHPLGLDSPGLTGNALHQDPGLSV